MVAKMKKGDYLIINGHHRWAAAVKVELKRVRVVVANPAAFCPSAGEHPVLVSEGAVASDGTWTIEAPGISKVSASLVERADGLYVRLDPKGMMFIVR